MQNIIFQFLYYASYQSEPQYNFKRIHSRMAFLLLTSLQLNENIYLES